MTNSRTKERAITETQSSEFKLTFALVAILSRDVSDDTEAMLDMLWKCFDLRSWYILDMCRTEGLVQVIE